MLKRILTWLKSLFWWGDDPDDNYYNRFFGKGKK